MDFLSVNNTFVVEDIIDSTYVLTEDVLGGIILDKSDFPDIEKKNLVISLIMIFIIKLTSPDLDHHIFPSIYTRNDSLPTRFQVLYLRARQFLHKLKHGNDALEENKYFIKFLS